MKKRVISILMQVKPELDELERVDFVSEGILDSFDIISLCEAFNSNFGITINGEDIVPENFESVDSMVNMLVKNGVNV